MFRSRIRACISFFIWISEDSFGKNGNGLGVHYAKNLIREMGGRFEISSEESAGTQIQIALPLIDEPKWFVGKVPDSKSLVILDDDPVIHERIKTRFAGRTDVHYFF